MSTNANFGWAPTTRNFSNVDLAPKVFHSSQLSVATMVLCWMHHLDGYEGLMHVACGLPPMHALDQTHIFSNSVWWHWVVLQCSPWSTKANGDPSAPLPLHIEMHDWVGVRLG